MCGKCAVMGTARHKDGILVKVLARTVFEKHLVSAVQI